MELAELDLLTKLLIAATVAVILEGTRKTAISLHHCLAS